MLHMASPMLMRAALPPVTATNNASGTCYGLGTFDFTPGNMLGGRDDTFRYRAYLRSQVALPSGTAVGSAILTVQQHSVVGSTLPTIRIVTADNAPTEVAASIFNATLDSATQVSITSGTGQKAYDVTAMVQLILNRAGWASGNSLMFCFDLTFNGSTDYVQWRGYDYTTSGQRPSLVITPA